MIPFTLKQLQILKTIAIEKNFTKASEILYISQPSISKQIKNLEKNLDVLLINRKKNYLYLTENGKIFLEYAERILSLCEESYRILIDLKNINRGILRIGASQEIGTYLLPKILHLFSSNYPQINLKIQINSTKLIGKHILTNKIDIALIEDEISDQLKKKIKMEDFLTDPLQLIISKFHPFAKKKKINKEEFYNLNLITLNSNSSIQQLISNNLIKNNIDITRLKKIIQLNSIESVKTAVSLGLGVAFLFSSTIEKELSLETIKIIKLENIWITRTIFLIINSNYSNSKTIRFFYSYLHNF